MERGAGHGGARLPLVAALLELLRPVLRPGPRPAAEAGPAPAQGRARVVVEDVGGGGEAAARPGHLVVGGRGRVVAGLVLAHAVHGEAAAATQM